MPKKYTARFHAVYFFLLLNSS
jgi:hypothetical protein